MAVANIYQRVRLQWDTVRCMSMSMCMANATRQTCGAVRMHALDDSITYLESPGAPEILGGSRQDELCGHGCLC